MQPLVPSKPPSLALDYRPALFSRSGIARVTRELARTLAPLLAEIQSPLRLYGHGFRSCLPAAEPPASATLHRSRLPGRFINTLAPLGLDAWSLSGKPQNFLWTDYVYPPIDLHRPCKVWMLVHDLAFIEDPRFHGPKASCKLRRRFEKALLRADHILYPSEATRQALLHYYPKTMQDSPSCLLPFGLDHVPTPPLSRVQAAKARAATLLQTSEPYLVILGTLEPRKNHDKLLSALQLLASRGTQIPLLVIGAAGWLSRDLQEALKKGTPRKGTPSFPLAWTGSIPDKDLFPLVAGAAGLVYPSSLEGFGFPPLEALLLGTPVLAGDCPALRETLGSQPGALFAKGEVPEDLAEKIPQLLGARTGSCEELRKKTWQKTAQFFLEQIHPQ